MQNQEKSCGCIITKQDTVLLVKHKQGHWDFPKGHIEEGETEKETAIREVKEETNLDVVIDSEKVYKIAYAPKKGIWKEVYFFLAHKIGGQEKPQLSEIAEVKWFSFEEAIHKITFANSKEVFRKAIKEREE